MAHEYDGIDGEVFSGGVDGYVGGPDIIGVAMQRVAATQGTAAARSAMQRAAQVHGLTGGAQVAQNVPNVARTQISPFPAAGSIAANASFTFLWQPQRPFRAQRMFMVSTGGGGDFVVTDIKVGADPQFVNDGEAPGSMFAPNSFGAELRANTANPGVTISVTIRNITGGPINVSGAIIGTALT